MAGGSRPLVAGLIVATVIAGALRFASLGSVPASLYCDEALHGYEAWSLLETGRDSRGVRLPLFFNLFGVGWGEPLYTYLTVPAVALFGLTPAACRFVAAAAGTLAVPLTGLMTMALLRGSPRAELAGVAAALTMAVSPWSFHLSRVGFQASLLPALLAAGFWLAATAVRGDGGAGPSGNPILGGRLAGAAALLGLSLYAYTVARLETPLLVAGFLWLNRHPLRASRRAALPAALTLLVLTLPVAAFSLTPAGRQRLSQVSLLSQKHIRDAGLGALAGRVASNYASYYSPGFLLIEGDSNQRHSVRGYGTLHPHDAFLALLGVAVCAATARSGARFLLWWLTVFPVAAALTIDAGHAVRSICGQPAIYALAGVGFARLWGVAAEARTRRWSQAWATAGAVAVIAGGLSVAVYFHDYFVAYPVYSAPRWQYGLKEAFDYTESVAAAHDAIYVTKQEEQAWIHLVFHRAMPPLHFQAHRLTRSKYVFERWSFPEHGRPAAPANPIFVLKPWEGLPLGVSVHKVIRYPNGTEAFLIAW